MYDKYSEMCPDFWGVLADIWGSKKSPNYELWWCPHFLRVLIKGYPLIMIQTDLCMYTVDGWTSVLNFPYYQKRTQTHTIPVSWSMSCTTLLPMWHFWLILSFEVSSFQWLKCDICQIEVSWFGIKYIKVSSFHITGGPINTACNCIRRCVHWKVFVPFSEIHTSTHYNTAVLHYSCAAPDKTGQGVSWRRSADQAMSEES